MPSLPPVPSAGTFSRNWRFCAVPERRKLQGVDVLCLVVGEDVSPVQLGVFVPAYHVPTDHALAEGTGVGIHRQLVVADQRVRLGLGTGNVPFAVGPLQVGPGECPADLLARTLPHVTDPDVPGGRVVGHPMGAARAQGPELLQDASSRVLPRVIVGDVVSLCEAVGPTGWRRRSIDRLPADGMADGAALHVHIDAEHPAEEPGADVLRPVVLVVRTALIAHCEIQEAVRPEEHVAPIVPVLAIELLHEDEFRSRVGQGLCRVHGEARQAHEGLLAAWVTHREVAIPHVEVACVGGSLLTIFRMQRSTQKSSILIDPSTVVDVQYLRFGARSGVVVEDPGIARFTEDHELARGQLQHFHRVVEGQVREGVLYGIGHGGTARRRWVGAENPVHVRPNGLSVLKTTVRVQQLGHEGYREKGQDHDKRNDQPRTNEST
jgi:hypothetical protein